LADGVAPPAPRVAAFWADFFDVPVEALDEPGVRVVAHAGLGDYSGAWFFVRGGACIVSVPPRWLQPLRDALRDRSLDAVLSEVGLATVFGEALAGTVGPVFHGHLEPASFRPYPARAVRAIERSDGRAVLALREACGEDAWQDGSVSSNPPGAFGWFEDGMLLAAASLTDWGANTVGPGSSFTRTGGARAAARRS